MRGFCLLPLPVFLALWGTPAAAAEPGPDACQVARDVALARIAAEEGALRTMLDADAAILEAPTYRLFETEKALLADLAAARARVEAEYRTCTTVNPVPTR